MTFTATAKQQAENLGIDLNDQTLAIQLVCQEMTQKMNFLINEVLTPAGIEGSNITVLNNQIAAIS